MKKLLLIILLVLNLAACANPGIIGVVYNQNGIVRQVYDKSPAKAAGVLLGDKILNTGDLRGRVGSVCHVRIERELQFIDLFITRVHIDSLQTMAW